jgi:hypothetical protein
VPASVTTPRSKLTISTHAWQRGYGTVQQSVANVLHGNWPCSTVSHSKLVFDTRAWRCYNIAQQTTFGTRAWQRFTAPHSKLASCVAFDSLIRHRSASERAYSTGAWQCYNIAQQTNIPYACLAVVYGTAQQTNTLHACLAVVYGTAQQTSVLRSFLQ